MMHRAWSSIVEVPYCFSRSYVKFQGHTAPKIIEFYPNWAFPDSNSSLNSPMAMKCCTKLETAKERCPIVFQGHPSNFKVTRDKTSPILTQIGRFRTIGRSQLSNPSDLPCCFNFGSLVLKTKIFEYSFMTIPCHVVWPISWVLGPPVLLPSNETRPCFLGRGILKWESGKMSILKVLILWISCNLIRPHLLWRNGAIWCRGSESSFGQHLCNLFATVP